MPYKLASPFTFYWESVLVDFCFKSCGAFLVACLSLAVGGFDQLIVSLMWLMILDFLLGFSRAWKECHISGSKMKHGIMKFILYGVAIQIGLHMQYTLAYLKPTVMGVDLSIALRDWLIAYLVLNEGLSCMSHLSYFGIPIPTRLIKRLKSYRDCIFHEKETPKEPQ